VVFAVAQGRRAELDVADRRPRLGLGPVGARVGLARARVGGMGSSGARVSPQLWWCPPPRPARREEAIGGAGEVPRARLVRWQFGSWGEGESSGAGEREDAGGLVEWRRREFFPRVASESGRRRERRDPRRW
jgi:hypothetical protein